jgi:hypothetical protein
MAEPILRNYRVQQHKNLSPPLLPSTRVRLIHESISVGSPPWYFVQCHLLCWIHTLHRRGVSTPECLLAAIQSQVERKVRVRRRASLPPCQRRPVRTVGFLCHGSPWSPAPAPADAQEAENATVLLVCLRLPVSMIPSLTAPTTPSGVLSRYKQTSFCIANEQHH